MNKQLNKKTIFTLAGIFVLSIAALSIYTYNTGVLAGDPAISEEEAISIAEDYTNGKAISVELEKEGSSMVYEVVIENETGRYEVEVDADDGTVLEVEEDDDEEEDDDNDEEDDDEDDNDDADEEHDDDDENEHEFEGEEEGDN